MQELNGMEVGGRAIKVGYVSDSAMATGGGGGGGVDLDDSEGGGLQMSAASRAMLMQRLASSEASGGGSRGQPAPVVAPGPAAGGAIQATECLVLRNMFDPKEVDREGEDSWREIEDDVEEEFKKYGTVHHIFVDRNSYGNIYIRLDNPAAGSAAGRSFNGRWFGGRQISVSFLDPAKYRAEIEGR